MSHDSRNGKVTTVTSRIKHVMGKRPCFMTFIARTSLASGLLVKLSVHLMSPKPLLRRTYGSQSSFKASELESPLRLTTNYGPLSRPLKRKLPIVELSQNIDNPKRRRAFKKTGKAEEEKKKQTLTQLHFTIDRSILRTCAICNLSYTHGAPADESLHKSHCSRFQKGIEWGKEDEKKRDKRGMDEVVCDSNIKLKSGETGRIIFVKPTIGGRLGHKVTCLCICALSS